MIEKTPYFSWRIKALPKGCRLCVQGKKLVLFVTGLCNRHCFYCPISDHKFGKDVIYANERPVQNDEDIIHEAKLCDAKGVGITGGNPLLVLDRTVRYIKLLKENFGEHFHTHLYAPVESLNKKSLEALYKAGLDELRIHLDIDNPQDWEKVKNAKAYDWDLGIEVPVIPGKVQRYIELINFASNNVSFLNLNELEYSDGSACKLSAMGYKTKNSQSYAINGSAQLALELLRICIGSGLKVHFCTAKLKDSVQLANRIKRRASKIKAQFDKITKDGTLIRGAIYPPESKPGNCKLDKINHFKRKEILLRLEEFKKKLRIQDRLISIDERKLRLLTSTRQLLRKLKQIKKEGFIPAIVEEYPTWDQQEIDVLFP